MPRLVDSCTAFYKFGDAPGALVADATGRGNDLTPNTDLESDPAAYFSIGRNANDGLQVFLGAMRAWGGAGVNVTSLERDSLYNAGVSARSWADLASTLQSKFRWWYDLAGTGATVTTDRTGNGSTLTIAGTGPTSVAGPGGAGSATHWGGNGQAYCADNAFVRFGNRYSYVCGWVLLDDVSATLQPVQGFLTKWQGISSSRNTEFVCYAHYNGSVWQFWGDVGKGGEDGAHPYANNVVVAHTQTLSAATWYFVEWECDPVHGLWSLAVNRGTPVVVSPLAQPVIVPGLFRRSKFGGGFTGGVVGLASGGTQASGVYDDVGQHYVAKASPGADLKMGNAARTVWLWFQLLALDRYQLLAGILDSADNLADWYVSWNPTGTQLAFTLNAGTTFAQAAVAVNDMLPHLVVAWFDKLGDGKLHLDLDHGALVASVTPGFAPATTTKDFRVGAAMGAYQAEAVVDGLGLADGVPVQVDLDLLWNRGRGVEYPFLTGGGGGMLLLGIG